MFGIVWRGQVIGHSQLEFGDPPMGVAFGRFVPGDGFTIFFETTLSSAGSSEGLRIWGNLSAVSLDGTALECIGVSLSRIEHGGDVDLQVEVVGIDWTIYRDLFPHHVQNYERRF